MVSLDKAILASYDHAGDHFELLVDPDNAYAYKEGSKKDLRNILVSDEIYLDSKKGEKAKAEKVKKVFPNMDIYQILEFILKNGEVQLTTEQRRKKTEEKYKQVVAILLRESIDPRTNAPHTLHRIETALEEARIHIDPFKDAREQLDDIIKKIRLILPLKFEKVRMAIKIPPEHAHRCYGTLKGFGIQREEWAGDGSLVAVVEIFAGMQAEFLDRLNKLTQGNIQTKLLDK